MAVVRSFFATPAHGTRHPTQVDCGYSVLEDDSGTVIQLSTYGSDRRQSQPKVSQTLQIDRQRAEELVRILRGAFPGLT